jgi:hypothetical protein
LVGLNCTNSLCRWEGQASLLMLADRYASALATVLHGSALPYGYTVTVWTSGAMLIRHHGLPSTGQVFLFAIGAVAAFALLGSVVRLGHGTSYDPPHGALRRTGMVNLLAVGGALGAATLVALIRSGIAWPLDAFVATATYLTLATLQLSLVER